MTDYKEPKPCACKGIRQCLLCENLRNIELVNATNGKLVKKTYIYCQRCHQAWLTSNEMSSVEDVKQTQSQSCQSHLTQDMIHFTGVDIQEEFVSSEEEEGLCKEVDRRRWFDSQSGRRKQDYGPKVNFKKRKLKLDSFCGLPMYSKTLVDRFEAMPSLAGFIPVELCNLEYEVDRGSAVDPHFDDFWLWGERLVTVNLLSTTILTFTKKDDDGEHEKEVLVLLPRRSLVVVFGPARYEWMHCIQRGHIHDRRLAMTFRELEGEFLEKGGAEYELGQELITRSLSYDGS